ncbi:hypothetical protein BFJ69_g16802 [Fusarium oxysporum]|uniref:Lysophospholipase n=1 Tax=Fusarium oxysporum TaxID=5507 RepID=A0A420MA29_FUSOX|nr:hypothetical protein BFJ69_g16802 [Fusarium oxysporum]
MMSGAGAIAAFDKRTTRSNDDGPPGDFLQAATYLRSAGLSVTGYYRELYQDVNDMVDAGYNKSITDYWGRALSYQLVNASDGGPAYTFPSIANDTDFPDTQTPVPIIIAIERTAGQLQITTNSTIVEFNPWEMRSYDPSLSAFATLKYVGSAFNNYTIKRGSQCIAGVDNVGFVMGTSSSLFNQASLQMDTAENIPDLLLNAINNTLADIGEENRDIANWPNPFYKYNPGNNSNINTTICGVGHIVPLMVAVGVTLLVNLMLLYV